MSANEARQGVEVLTASTVGGVWGWLCLGLAAAALDGAGGMLCELIRRAWFDTLHGS